jgi:hypothetical protein
MHARMLYGAFCPVVGQSFHPNNLASPATFSAHIPRHSSISKLKDSAVRNTATYNFAGHYCVVQEPAHICMVAPYQRVKTGHSRTVAWSPVGPRYRPDHNYITVQGKGVLGNNWYVCSKARPGSGNPMLAHPRDVLPRQEVRQAMYTTSLCGVHRLVDPSQILRASPPRGAANPQIAYDKEMAKTSISTAQSYRKAAQKLLVYSLQLS